MLFYVSAIDTVTNQGIVIVNQTIVEVKTNGIESINKSRTKNCENQ